MDIRNYLDSTFLKLPAETGLSNDDHLEAVRKFIVEAIEEKFAAVMIRPDMVAMAKEMMSSENANVAIGTVIGFHQGTASIAEKIIEAEKAISDGADELDFVINYTVFLNGDTELVREEVYQGTRICRLNNKVVKWIIETAALDVQQIAQLSALVKSTVFFEFTEDDYPFIFVKSSTGYFTASDGQNGATMPAIITMLENASPLPIKASGGIKSYDDAVAYINLGVKRIGTSAAKAIANGGQSLQRY